MKYVTLLTFENALASSVVGAMEVFYLADFFQARHQKRQNGQKIQFDIATHDGKSVSGLSGIPITATRKVTDIRSTDFIIITGVWEKIDEMLASNRHTLYWLVERHRENAGILAFSTGVFLLAETGLLDGKEATTYWSYREQFAARYPKIKLKPDKMITSSDHIYCCVGMNSWTASLMHIIESTHGIEVAQNVEKHYLVDSTESYPISNLSFTGQMFHEDAKIKAVQKWIESNYAQNVVLEDIAVRFGMSLRNLTRRFKSATGESLLTYLHRYRIEVSRELLKAGPALDSGDRRADRL
ncbi:DJ-1/PfpI family protein [bacterium]|nr:DJ-1/PfpI family protein [bacterium]